MILVDIYVASVNKLYDFKLDENVYIADVLEEIGAMMVHGTDFEKRLEDLILCDFEAGKILPLNCTMKQAGIGNGCRLVLL